MKGCVKEDFVVTNPEGSALPPLLATAATRKRGMKSYSLKRSRSALSPLLIS